MQPWRPASLVRVAVISCIPREPERVRTLAQLRAAGLNPIFEPYLNECTSAADTGGKHGRVWFEKALQDALDDEQTGILICEDDIDARPALAPALELAVMLDEFTDFCIWRPRHHPDALKQAIETRRSIRPGLYEIKHGSGWYGTQCVYIPAWLIRRYFKHPGRASFHAFDSMMAVLLRDGKYPIYAAYPNPVQHRNPHSIAELVRGHGHRGLHRVSDTFDLLPARPWGERVAQWKEAIARGENIRPG